MNISLQKVMSIITPLALLVAFALLMIIYGIAETSKGGHENYGAFLYIIGLPLLLICLTIHFAVQWYFDKRNLPIWITESVLVVALIGFFYFNQ